MSIHAHMTENLKAFNGEDIYSDALREILTGKSVSYKVKANELNFKGKATGILVGGNMSVMCGVIGSQFDLLKNDNMILFLEDVGENFERVNRMFYQLRINGAFDRIKGIVVGDFKNSIADQEFDSMNSLILSIVEEYKIPVAFGFPCGHIDENYPLLEGAKASLDVNDDGVTLSF